MHLHKQTCTHIQHPHLPNELKLLKGCWIDFILPMSERKFYNLPCARYYGWGLGHKEGNTSSATDRPAVWATCRHANRQSHCRTMRATRDTHRGSSLQGLRK